MSLSVFLTRHGQLTKVVKVSNTVPNENQKGENVRINVWTIAAQNYKCNMVKGGEGSLCLQRNMLSVRVFDVAVSTVG